MDIPLDLLDSVAFLEVKEGDFFKPIGTAFFLTHKEGADTFAYLVTCRHVIEDSLKVKTQIFVRINRLNKPGFEHIPLYTKWVFHEKEGIDLVDLAVLPVEPISEIENETIMGSLSSELIYGREGMRQLFKRDFQVGDDVVFYGLFPHYQGHTKNYPIVRFGKASLITDEGLPGVEPWLGVNDYFLVECQAYPGMSGSPVFAMKEYEGIERYFLIGIIAGYYSDDQLVENRFSHFGISQVVPVEKLGDIIWGDELIADRHKKTGNGGVTLYPSRNG